MSILLLFLLLQLSSKVEFENQSSFHTMTYIINTTQMPQEGVTLEQTKEAKYLGITGQAFGSHTKTVI